MLDACRWLQPLAAAVWGEMSGAAAAPLSQPVVAGGDDQNVSSNLQGLGKLCACCGELRCHSLTDSHQVIIWC